MELQLYSTDKIVELNGVPARLWEGYSASGARVIAYVTRIQLMEPEKSEEFDRELREQRPPSPEALGIPLRLIL